MNEVNFAYLAAGFVITVLSVLLLLSLYDSSISLKRLACRLFGHKPPIYAKKGWYSPGEEYALLVVGVTDGIGRVHGTVRSDCPRCGINFTLCRVHIPDTSDAHPTDNISHKPTCQR